MYFPKNICCALDCGVDDILEFIPNEKEKENHGWYKEQERDELHRAIWAIADELRGAVDGWDFKNYILGTMFYRYISENLTNYINSGEQEAGNTDFDYVQMPDTDAEEARDGLVEEKGFFILPSELFCNVNLKADNDENLNETLERVFNHIESSAKGSSSESSFAGLFDDFDVNSNKLGSTVAKRNERLAKLLHGVADMNLGDVKDHDIDAFGDAYEYLMTMYASGAGKSGGEFLPLRMFPNCWPDLARWARLKSIKSMIWKHRDWYNLIISPPILLLEG